MRIFHLRLKLYGSTTWEEGEIRSWFCLRKTETSRMGPETWLQTKTRLKTLTCRNRITAMLVSDSCYRGKERGTRQHPAAVLNAYILTNAEKLSTEGCHARCQHLTLTWEYPFRVDTSEEYGSCSCLQTAVYSSKRGTVDALISILVSRHMCGIAAFRNDS